MIPINYDYYFALLEKAFDDKGKEYAKAQKDKLCDPNKPIAGYIYFVTDGAYVKVGRTKNIERRMSELQTSNAKSLQILSSIPFNDLGQMYFTECMIHRALKVAGYHVGGEWFDIMPLINGSKPRDNVNALAECFIPYLPSSDKEETQLLQNEELYSISDLQRMLPVSINSIKKYVLSDPGVSPHIKTIDGQQYIGKTVFDDWLNKQCAQTAK